MNNNDQPQSTPGFPDSDELDNLDFTDLDNPDQLGVKAGLWSTEPVSPATFPLEVDLDLDLDLDLDDAHELVTIAPGRAADLHAAGIPWDLVHLVGADDDPNRVAAELRHRVKSFSDDQVTGDIEFEPSHVSFVAGAFRRTLNSLLKHESVDGDTVDVALRLGDLLAASGNPVEALTEYRRILERLTADGSTGADRVAERVEAVISLAGLGTGHRSPVVSDLASMVPLSQPDPDAARQRYQTMVNSAHRDVNEITLLQQGIDNMRRVTDRDFTADLDSTALRNGSAAFVRLSDTGPGSDSRDLFDLLISALLDTSLGAFRVVDSFRGREHQVRFAHHCIVRSPRLGGTHSEHVQAVLDTPLASRNGMLLRNVMSGLGAFVEDSAVLLEEWNRREGLSDRDVVINCPLLLRNREAPNLSASDSAAPHLASLIVTSLGWGGAADIGAIVADEWDWGYAAANDAQRLLAFGGWTEDPNGRRRQSEGAQSLLRTTNALLDGLDGLPRRVCVLDEPRGAIEALASRYPIGSPQQPVAVVAIVMSERRIHWVAQHMLSYGGAVTPSAQEIADREADLLRLQRQLQEVVKGCRSESTPVLVIDMEDHLEDGYAERTGNDPVDEDFDCFYRTAQKLRFLTDHLTISSASVLLR